MRKFELTATAVAAGMLLCASSANANMITINAMETGSSLQTIVLPTTSPVSFATVACCTGVNSFTLVGGGATGTPPSSSGVLDSNTGFVMGSGTINIWVTETGLTSPLGSVSFTSGLTSNMLAAGSMVTLTTFLNPNDSTAPSSGNIMLGTATFSSIGTQMMSNTVATGPGPYSLQEEYSIMSTGGIENLTIDLSATPAAVPEPGSLALVGSALAGLGLLLRRRRV